MPCTGVDYAVQAILIRCYCNIREECGQFIAINTNINTNISILITSIVVAVVIAIVIIISIITVLLISCEGRHSGNDYSVQ